MLKLEHVAWDLPGGRRESFKDMDLTTGRRETDRCHRPKRRRENHAGKTDCRCGNSRALAVSCLTGEDITQTGCNPERARKGIAYAFQQPVRFQRT